MTNPELNILVEPKDELVFNGPFDRIVTSKITLTNPRTEKYYFKVKTTVPKSYCVKPSSGYIAGGESSEVEVHLQPGTVNLSEKNKHKFLIQFLKIPSDSENIDIESLWKSSGASPEDYKLKCVMKQPDEKIEIDPPTNIIFQGPFDKPVTSFIKITNASDNPVCFKIQTTTPKKYSVTPNQGFVEAHKVQHIGVTLHSFAYNPNEQVKERFLLQYAVTPEVIEYSDKIWKDYDNKKVEYIIKSVYQMPDVNGTAESKYKSEIKELKAKLEELKSNEERLRRVHMATSNLQPGPSASQQPGFLANNATLFIFIAFVIGILSGKFYI